MLKDFYTDLHNAKAAEQIVRSTFAALTDQYNFDDVSNRRECFYKGDILATDKQSGKQIYIEVKDDSRIADTRNILCEEKVWYKDGCYFSKGNMKSSYDIYTIVSKAEKKIYVIDFAILKANYKQGVFKVIYHADQDTYCYLLPLATIKRKGGIIAVIDYTKEDGAQ